MLTVYKRHFVYLQLISLILLFLPFDEFLHEKIVDFDAITGFTNYLSLFISLFFLLIFKNIPLAKYNYTYLYLIILILFVINIFFAPYAEIKWLINQAFFMLISVCVYLFYTQYATFNLKNINNAVYCITLFMLIILALSSLYLCIFNYSYLIRALQVGDFNTFVNKLKVNFSWEKQSIGAFALFAYCLMFTYKGSKKLLLLLFLISLPLLAGIRTFWLASSLSTLLYVLKNKRYWFFVPFLIIALLIFVFSKAQNIGDIWQFDIRVLNYLTMFSIVKNYFFGIGLGGFDDYVAINSAKFLGQYSFASIYYGRMVGATEADIVGVFSYLGGLWGAIFYAIQIVIFIKAFRVINKLENSLSRFFCFYYMAFILSGIGQDSMFKLFYWVSFGGVLAVVDQSNKLHWCRNLRSYKI